ncbi:unnamed protein product, partial [Symbiodinium necroappetens]
METQEWNLDPQEDSQVLKRGASSNSSILPSKRIRFRSKTPPNDHGDGDPWDPMDWEWKDDYGWVKKEPSDEACDKGEPGTENDGDGRQRLTEVVS